MTDANTPRLMKDGLAKPAIARLSRCLKSGYPSLQQKKFEADCLRGLGKLELKTRVAHVIVQLRKHLPTDFVVAREAVLATTQAWDRGDPTDALRGFAAWPLIDWVADAGLEHPELALEALRQMTHLFSAEFAVRPFLVEHPKLALSTMKIWCKDTSHEVRRLVSEGTRPRLPWGPQLRAFVADPKPCLPLLEALKDDPSEYVRRSVANHLNDITKDNPKLAVKLCGKWIKNASPERKWIVRHALRSLVKQGDPSALGVLGVTTNPDVKGSVQLGCQRLRLGQTLELALEVRSTSASQQHVVVDYEVLYKKASGSSAAKVFKLKTLTLEPGGTERFTKRQLFKDLSTRKHYPGKHRVTLLVSGRRVAHAEFTLSVPSAK